MNVSTRRRLVTDLLQRGNERPRLRTLLLSFSAQTQLLTKVLADLMCWGALRRRLRAAAADLPINVEPRVRPRGNRAPNETCE